MWKEFKAFAFKGNLIDLAIAFVLGAAFTTLVQALVADLIMPIIGIVGGKHGAFGDRSFSINGSVFSYGDLLNKLVSFLIVASVLFLVIKAVTSVQQLERGSQPQPAPAVKPCPYCFETINAHASRCPRCTSELAAA
jgi:large conductance mechanosensitive channel